MNETQLWNDHTFRVLLEDLFKARKDEQLGPLRLAAIRRYMGETPALVPVGVAKRNGFPPTRQVPINERPALGQSFGQMQEIAGDAVAFSLGEASEMGLELVELGEDGQELPAGFVPEEGMDGEDGPERQSFCYKCKAGRKVKRSGKIWRCMTCSSSNVNSIPTPHDKNLGAYVEGEAVHRSNPIEALNKTATLIEENVKAGRLVFTIPKTCFVQGIKEHLKSRRFAFSDIDCVMAPGQVHIDTTSASAISGEIGSRSGGWTITVTR